MKREWQVLLFMACAVLTSSAFCGPYNEPGIPGYVGPDGLEASPLHANAVSNPVFRAWAVEVVSYEPAPDVGYDWSDPQMALGTATGDVMDIVSLGDLSASQITAGTPAGRITLAFAEPFADGPGFEFAVFENACEFEQMFAELAYVEVSSDGVHFARFDSVSLTPSQVGPYGMIRPDDVFNLAGKHPNAYDVCTGTAFDLDELRGDPEVVAGRVDMNNINHVRIVDIPGSGHFLDRASRNTDPCSWPPWEPFDSDIPYSTPG